MLLQLRVRSALALRRVMPFQIHAVMQQSEHINDIALLTAAAAEHDEMSALAPASSDLVRMDIVADFRVFLHPNDGGAGA